MGAPGIIPDDDTGAGDDTGDGETDTETDIPLTNDILELMINSLCGIYNSRKSFQFFTSPPPRI